MEGSSRDLLNINSPTMMTFIVNDYKQIIYINYTKLISR